MPILFSKNVFLYTWAMRLFIGMHLDFAHVSFRVRYGAPWVRSLNKLRVKHCRRTPRLSVCLLCIVNNKKSPNIQILYIMVPGLLVGVSFVRNHREFECTPCRGAKPVSRLLVTKVYYCGVVYVPLQEALTYAAVWRITSTC